MALMIHLGQSVVASPDHVACDLDNETVILSLKSGEYFGLNAVAAAVWKMIQEPRAVTAVRDSLLGQFQGVTPQQCETELINLLNQLEALQLVEAT